MIDPTPASSVPTATEHDVRRALFDAARTNGHIDRHGERQTLATIDSGLRAGMARPRRSA
jgi:hypothetical protein